MGGCLQKCCLSETGTICCNLISILGIIYFVFTWAMFERQFDFFEFHIPNRSETRLSVIVAALFYLLFFIWTLYRLHKMNQQKAQAAIQRSKKSLDQYNNLPSVYEEAQKQANTNSQRAMARQE